MTVKFDKHLSFLLLVFLLCMGLGSNLLAQDENDQDTAESVVGDLDNDGLDDERRLTFSFSSTPWREVLEWIADECELSFNLDYTPRGSLNFIDVDRKYTPAEALDEINGQLLARGYTLVRRYKTLYIVDLDAEIDRKFISDLLNDTPVENLDKLGRFELGKVKFQLKAISTEDAEKQIENVVGPHGYVITVPLARQLIVSETGENLRRIKNILDNVEARVGAEGLRAFRLKSATGDDVLAVAKPLLGIEADASAAEDGSIRISTDTKGKMVYATGAPEKIALVEQIVKQVDEDAAANGRDEELSLISHRVRREDPQVVIRILETLFSGDPRVRLQTRADSVLAYATLDQHRLIQTTISEVEQEPTRIEVIPLRRNDPMLAVALIERMFGVDSEEPDENAPIVDATFDPNQLIIKGNAAQIEQIRTLLGDMGERISADGKIAGPTTRVLPIAEADLPRAIEQLRQLWPSVGNGNRIRIMRPRQSPLLRVVPRAEESKNGEEQQGTPAPTPSRTNTTAVDRHRVMFVSHPVVQEDDHAEPEPTTEAVQESTDKAAPEIILSPTPDGLVVVTEDAAAADALEELLLRVVGSGSGPKYHIFHLKHVDAEETLTLLETLFTGGAADDAASGADRSGAMALFSGSSSTLGAPKIIADKRLNRLFVEGSLSQIRDVQQYLQVIDIEDGPVDVQTNPKPTYIPVFFSSAESIVDVLKEIYADRLYDPNQRNRQAGGRGGGPVGFGGFGGFGRGGGRGGDEATQTTTGEVAKMTIAAEPNSNLVIVSAPGPLVKEVEDVVRKLDEWAENAPTEDYQIGRLNTTTAPDQVKAFLKGSYGDIVQTEGDGLVAATNNQNSSNSRTGASTATDAAAQRRAAFFQMMRGGGGPGGGGGGPGAFRGASPFGGGIRAFGGGGPGGGGRGGGGSGRGGGGRGGRGG